MNDNTPVKQRLHITFGKFDALIYTSNLDIAKLWERVLRRADLPILYSEGFNPRPRIALASALPLGISSECEILDVSFREVISLEGLAERILAISPSGLQIFDIREVPIRSPALQTLVRSAEYRIHFENEMDYHSLQEKVSDILRAESLYRERERKDKVVTVNLRPLICDLRLDEQGDLIAHLVVGEQGNVRPDEVLAEMGLADEPVSVHRFALHLVT
jgi:radical SAM-linked protein